MPDETTVAAPKLSTFSTLSIPQEIIVEETVAAPVVDEGVINMPEAPAEATTEQPAQAAEAPVVEATTDAPAEQAPIEGDSIAFDMPSFDEPAPGAQQQASPAEVAAPDWKTAIKSVDLKDLLKEAGVDDFIIELNTHIKNGGQAADYLAAKAMDWNAVSDLDIVRSEFKAKYPTLSAEELDRKITRKYALEELDEDLKSDGEIDLKADAYEIRQARIERDKKFVIPQTPIAQANEDAVIQRVLETQQKQQKENYDRLSQQVAEHETTKALMQSKRVAVDVGGGRMVNLQVDKPEFVTRAIYDASVWNKLIANEKGEPNVQLLQELVLYAANPAKFKSNIYGSGKSDGIQSVVAEGQNAKRPLGQAARTDETPTYRTGTYGQMQLQN